MAKKMSINAAVAMHLMHEFKNPHYAEIQKVIRMSEKSAKGFPKIRQHAEKQKFKLSYTKRGRK